MQCPDNEWNVMNVSSMNFNNSNKNENNNNNERGDIDPENGEREREQGGEGKRNEKDQGSIVVTYSIGLIEILCTANKYYYKLNEKYKVEREQVVLWSDIFFI